MSTPDRFRFTLTKRQVNDLEDNLPLDGGEYVNCAVEQPDGTFQFDLRYEDMENLVESLAAACEHAEDEQTAARLDAIYDRLAKTFEA